MFGKLFQLRTLVRDVPTTGKLAYCLLRDSRVPATHKAAFAAGLAVASPLLDLSALIPFLGELDGIALGMLSARLFVGSCDQQLVDYHRDLIASRSSTFDSDLESGRLVAQQWATKVKSLGRKSAIDSLKLGETKVA